MTAMRPSSAGWLLLAALGGGVAGAAMLYLAAPHIPVARTQTEAIVRDYILAHPEILPEAMKRLQAKESGQLVARHRPALETPFEGAWAGAQNGDVTLVMFTDYSCGYCRASAADVDRLLADDKKLKVVWREIPILGPGSEAASRAALAAAQQGRYLDFHRRMFAAGPPDEDRIARVLDETGVSPAAGQDRAQIGEEIENNLSLARDLGMTGTPTFVIEDQVLQGAVGYDALKDAIAKARKSS
ncbi:MAG: DsbA family protein [Sphingomonadaceae bacterium]